MTPRLYQRITRARNASYNHCRNTFQGLDQIMLAARQVAGTGKIASLRDEEIHEIIRQHIGIYESRKASLNNPPEGSGAYPEFVDMQQRIHAIEVYLPLEREIELSPLQEV